MFINYYGILSNIKTKTDSRFFTQKWIELCKSEYFGEFHINACCCFDDMFSNIESRLIKSPTLCFVISKLSEARVISSGRGSGAGGQCEDCRHRGGSRWRSGPTLRCHISCQQPLWWKGMHTRVRFYCYDGYDMRISVFVVLGGATPFRICQSQHNLTCLCTCVLLIVIVMSEC